VTVLQAGNQADEAHRDLLIRKGRKLCLEISDFLIVDVLRNVRERIWMSSDNQIRKVPDVLLPRFFGEATSPQNTVLRCEYSDQEDGKKAHDYARYGYDSR
jgi:hypothetical protein